MSLPKVQYITHPDEDFENFSWVHRLHEAGVRWIQLRIKEEDFYVRNSTGHYRAYLIDKADQLKVICDALGITLCLNDHPEIAFLCGIEVIHVGQSDPSIEEVKEVAGTEVLVGLSLNSMEDVHLQKAIPAGYFGMGPLRSTQTKLDTKVNLGFDGYASMISSLRSMGLNQPIFAIGGITVDDLPKLKDLGVYGVCISGLIFYSQHNVELIQKIVAVFPNESLITE